MRTLLALVVSLPAILAPRATALDASDWKLVNHEPSAQMWMPSSPSQLPVSSRDLELYAEWLGLSGTQRRALDDLLQGIADEHLADWVEFAEARNDARSGAMVEANWADMQRRTNEALTAYEQERERLLDAFFDDVRLILDADQEERWPRVERHRLRASTLTQLASHDLEAVDLVSACRSLDLSGDERAALEPVLLSYEATLHSLIEARNRRAESLADTFQQISEEQFELQAAYEEDPESIDHVKVQADQQRLAERRNATVGDALAVYQAGARIRDLNVQTIAELDPLIPDHARDDWEDLTNVTVPDDQMAFASAMQDPAKQALRMLKNIHAQASMMEQAVSVWMGDDVDHPYRQAVVFARSVEPVSADQRQRLDRIAEDLERELDRLEPADEDAPADGQQDELRVRIPGGSVRLHRVDAERPPSTPWDQPQTEEAKRERRERLEINQRHLDRIREVLSLRQRALLVFQ